MLYVHNAIKRRFKISPSVCIFAASCFAFICALWHTLKSGGVGESVLNYHEEPEALAAQMELWISPLDFQTSRRFRLRKNLSRPTHTQARSRRTNARPTSARQSSARKIYIIRGVRNICRGVPAPGYVCTRARRNRINCTLKMYGQSICNYWII